MMTQVIHVSDDAASSSQAIMNALAEAQRLPPGIRGIVMLASGSYGLEKTLRIPNGSCLIGEPGRDVKLWPKELPDGTHMCNPGSNCIIQGLTFSGRESENVPHTIKCHLFGAKGDGVEVKQLNVIDCRFVDTERVGSAAHWQCCSFKCSLTRGVAFDSCVFDKGDNQCLTLGHGTAEAIRFRNCTFGESRYWSVNFEPTDGHHVRDVAFIECNFDARRIPVADGIVSISLDSSDIKFRRCLFRGEEGVIRRIRVQGQPAGTPSKISFVDCFGIGARVTLENKYPADPVTIPPPDQLRTYWH